MTLTPNIERSEAMLGFNDPTLAVGSGADTAKIALGGENGDGFFATLLDVINPLQHIPLVSSLYRDITGDEISPAARIIGGGLFGGPIGLASASANAVFEQASGDDVLGHAVALFSDGGPDPLLQADAGTPDTNVAALDPTPGAAAGNAPQPGAFVFAGPSALASHARQAAATAMPTSLTPDTPAPNPVATPVLRPAAVQQTTAPVIETARPVTPNPDAATRETDAFIRDLPANWVNEAMRDAETLNAALQTGAAPEIGAPKPWVGNAMLDALAKYDALTRSRAAATNGPS